MFIEAIICSYTSKNTQANHAHKIKTMFYKTDMNSLKTKMKFNSKFKRYQKAKPNSPSLNGVKRQAGFRNSKKMLQCFSKLVFDYIDFRRELDMTNDKDLFIEEFRKDFCLYLKAK